MVHYCDKQVFAPHARFEVFLPIADRYVVGAEVADVFKERLDFESPER